MAMGDDLSGWSICRVAAGEKKREISARYHFEESSVASVRAKNLGNCGWSERPVGIRVSPITAVRNLNS